MSGARTRVLLGSPIHQKPAILEQFLNSLLRLRLNHIELHFYFIDDNQDEASSRLLQQFAGSGREVFLQTSGFHDAYIRDDTTHFWNSNLVWKVAAFKNLMIRRADAFGYDYLFLIDSDLILHPDTLLHLLATDKDIISEVFWTQWQPGAIMQPQVWVHDEYNQWEVLPGEQLSREEINHRFHAFLQKLQQPGVYEVGGLGACTLISSRAIASGVSYDRVRNISYWGEDRHFCIRAAALGIPLFVDTHYPALHLYRDSDLQKVAEFVQAEEADAGNQAVKAPPGEADDAPADKRALDGAAQWDALWSKAEAQRRLSKEPLAPGGDGSAAEPPDRNPAAGGEADAASGADAEALAADAEVEAAAGKAIDGAGGEAARRPKLTLTMVVKNEGKRFLRQVLQEHRQYIDEAVIIDDGSTDDTAEICREVLQGIPLHLVRNDVSRFNHESELRKQQWEAVVQTGPEWILSLDADEMFESGFRSEVDSLLRTDNCDLFCFRLYDFWNDNHYREDMYWRSHQSYRPFLVRYREDFNYLWNDLPQHSGRLPENVFELSHQLSNLRLKHLGWSKPEYRLEKYLRYMTLDPDGQYGWKEQYLSILDPHPHLVPWSE
ncbi:glycosyltransferase [Paenibacillus sp. MMS20-IR301]|uniref:glycosyltransferase n=1 Tax=Paenibacillus sp. MMS20-IR301 TaxID=2895946 RepID=UPI0028EFE896|nr:glycosyltransferase [Paenibacillus sp. MMS20-IR301]WNS41950.1 glycosyltransferase [Paenibacillus sp. MMS20-IR301]